MPLTITLSRTAFLNTGKTKQIRSHFYYKQPSNEHIKLNGPTLNSNWVIKRTKIIKIIEIVKIISQEFTLHLLNYISNLIESLIKSEKLARICWLNVCWFAKIEEKFRECSS